MTATKPLIFKTGEAKELVTDTEEYFCKLNRVTLIPDLAPITVETLAERLINIIDEKHSYLVVVNTIKSSIQLYKLLKSKLNIPCIYLSTNIIPLHRAERIKLIKKYNEQHKNIVVISTQVVEAGVDINMDVVIRDIGPIDSIIQVAGRCKRNSLNDCGKVYIVKLINEKNNRSDEPLAKRIYGAIHCLLATKALQNGIIEEKAFYNLINNYFNDLEISKSQDESKYILEALQNFRFYKKNSDIVTVSSFSLIDKKPNYADIFVEVDNEARNVWSTYIKKVINEKDQIKKRKARLEIKSKLNAYIISVPLEMAIGLEPNMAISEDKTFWKLPFEGLNFFYDLDTGFKRSMDADVWMIG